MPKDLKAIVRAVEMQSTEPKLSYSKTAKVEWNLYIHEKSKYAFKSSSTKAHCSILRLPLRQYVEQQTDITFTFISSQFHVSASEPMQVVIAPAFQFPTSFLLIWSITWAYARLQSSPCVNLATSCNLVHVLTFYNLSFLFGTYASRLVAPAVQFPMDLCSVSAIQPISFLLVVSQNSFNSSKLQISNPKFPLLLFTLSNTLKQSYTTVYSSLRILCKAPMLQISLNSMPAFW